MLQIFRERASFNHPITVANLPSAGACRSVAEVVGIAGVSGVEKEEEDRNKTKTVINSSFVGFDSAGWDRSWRRSWRSRVCEVFSTATDGIYRKGSPEVDWIEEKVCAERLNVDYQSIEAK